MELLNYIEAAAAEVPENVGKALSLVGEEIDKLGKMMQALAARMDKLDGGGQ